jgi:hypothetical protein
MNGKQRVHQWFTAGNTGTAFEIAAALELKYQSARTAINTLIGEEKAKVIDKRQRGKACEFIYGLKEQKKLERWGRNPLHVGPIQGGFASLGIGRYLEAV